MSRTITTAAELDALHDERVLLEASGSYRYGNGTFEECWVRPVPPWITGTPERVWEVLVHGDKAPLSLVHTEDIDLPVTVLHDPSAPAPAPSVVPEAVEAVIFEADDECVLEVHEVRSLADRLLARFTITPKEDR